MKNYWRLALILSLLVHLAFIVKVPAHISDIFLKNKSKVKKERTKEIIISPQKIETIVKKPLLNPEKSKPLPYVEDILSKLLQNKNSSSLQKPRIFEENIKATVFTKIPKKVAKALKKNPAYMDYYRLIRERIKTNAYQNYKGVKEGEVLVSFLVKKDGSLKSIALDPQSSKNSNLATITSKSVKESAPFPKFPKDLANYSHLQFNISIYFKSN